MEKEKVNILTKSEYPLFFSFLSNNEEPYHEERDHRRGSSFYVTQVYLIDEDTLAEFKQEYELTDDLSCLLGFWQSPNRFYTDSWGFDDDLDCLTKVTRNVRVIEEEYFTPIANGKEN